MLLVLAATLLLALHVVPRGWGIALLAATVAVEAAQNVLAVRWSRRLPAAVGTEAMRGRRAVVVEPCRPSGRVRVGAESWRARCAAGESVEAGETVVVEGVERLTLLVRRPPSGEPGFAPEGGPIGDG